MSRSFVVARAPNGQVSKDIDSPDCSVNNAVLAPNAKSVVEQRQCFEVLPVCGCARGFLSHTFLERRYQELHRVSKQVIIHDPEKWTLGRPIFEVDIIVDGATYFFDMHQDVT